MRSRSTPKRPNRVAGVLLSLLLAPLPRPANADPVDACISSAEAGQRLRLEAKLTSAREKLLACSQAECPTVLRADCTKWLSELDRVFPSLVVRAVNGAGADVVDVSVTIDDQRIAPRLDGSEIHVDPGAHVFRFALAGGPTIEQKILVREGEQHRILSVVFPAPPVEQPSAPLPPPAPPPPRSLALPLAVVGAGAIAFGVASYFWISGVSEHSNLASTCAPSHSCDPSAVDSAHAKLVAGDVVGGVGVGLLAVGAGIFLFGGKKPAQPALALSLHPRTGGSLLTLRASF